MKKSNGVTLVSLIITVIILLILAGVSIKTLIGTNGILTQASRAKEQTTKAKIDEQYILAQAEANLNIQNREYIDDNKNKAIIPAGFAVSQVKGEQNIDTGLVIIDKHGNEFVWIPVNSVDNIAKKTSGVDNKGNENYQGKLYNFSKNVISEMEEYGQGTTSYREPDIVSAYDNSEEGYLNEIDLDVSKFKNEITEYYNSMIESVKRYKGFYIGRYETCIDKKTVGSKKDVLPMTADEASGKMWYGMYNKQKKFATENSLNSIEASMIWGSQYDAMINWVLQGKDKEKIFENQNAPHNLTEAYKCGAQPNDKINNIFDLEGNLREWTLEALFNNVRVLRGGNFNMNFNPRL